MLRPQIAMASVRGRRSNQYVSMTDCQSPEPFCLFRFFCSLTWLFSLFHLKTCRRRISCAVRIHHNQFIRILLGLHPYAALDRACASGVSSFSGCSLKARRTPSITCRQELIDTPKQLLMLLPASGLGPAFFQPSRPLNPACFIFQSIRHFTGSMISSPSPLSDTGSPGINHGFQIPVQMPCHGALPIFMVPSGSRVRAWTPV